MSLASRNHETEPLLPGVDLEGQSRLDETVDMASRSEYSEAATDPRNTRRWSQRLTQILPEPVLRISDSIASWIRGPSDAQPQRIRPLFAEIQQLPVRLLHRVLPTRRQRIGLLVVYIGVWLLTFALMFRKSTFAAEVEGWGVPQNLGCGDSYWVRDNKCGLDGNMCRPFNGSGFAFKCPASCDRYQLLNPRMVGDLELIYQPLIVGGPRDDNDRYAIYRGDSFICQAAIHSGVLDSIRGGCGIVQLIGQSQDYVGSRRNGLESVSFPSYFPLSYTFLTDIPCNAKDLRWHLFGVNLSFMVVLSLFTSSATVFFFTIMPAMFWHVGMASDPPPFRTVALLIERLVGRFLPAMFVAFVMYFYMGVSRTLTGLGAHVEKTILWLGGCWVGALHNYTLNRIPLSRLTVHDLNQQPGAKASLAMIILFLVVVVILQAYELRKEGRLPTMLRWYGLTGVALLVLAMLPNLTLRIHHYFLAILFLPGTSMQTRLSLLFQGLLIGLFVNGVARWGFDSILQTPYTLQGDAIHNSPLPVILPPNITRGDPALGNVSSITFTWEPPPGPRYDGLSVLVNDVERFRAYFDEGKDTKFVWRRDGSLGLPEYFRFGYMEGTMTWDYTRAGLWDVDGEWTPMLSRDGEEYDV